MAKKPVKPRALKNKKRKQNYFWSKAEKFVLFETREKESDLKETLSRSLNAGKRKRRAEAGVLREGWREVWREEGEKGAKSCAEFSGKIKPVKHLLKMYLWHLIRMGGRG